MMKRRNDLSHLFKSLWKVIMLVILVVLSFGLPAFAVEEPPLISLNRYSFNFNALVTGATTDDQIVTIENGGGGTLQWTVAKNATWLSVSPSSGTGKGTVTISVDATGLAVGTYSGGVYVSSPDAVNSPNYIIITLSVLQTSRPPFGQFEMPKDSSNVKGNVSVTGWALDDIGVTSVKIYSGNTYIADALFRENLRPDVEMMYPNFPLNYRTGWKYTLLSKSFANGTYTLVAKATDKEGNTVELGSKTITIANTITPPALTVTSPNGSESWEGGTSHPIEWTSSGSVGDVKIEYSTDNGSSWTSVTDSTPNDGYHNWNVPQTAASLCKVRITDTRDDRISDTSDAAFSIYLQEMPLITLSRTQLSFGSIISGPTTGTQSFAIKNSGEGTMQWTVEHDNEWLDVSPAYGTGNGLVTVSVDAAGLTNNTYKGTITINSPGASNSGQTVLVTLIVHQSGREPFGTFDSPGDDTIVYGSIPVTGWVLDDVGVESVKIYREENNNNGLVFIGDAAFVENARPDVEAFYPGYPENFKAGWGYMLLTNFLPKNGNGTFTLHAIATDLEGNTITLGTKTVTADNANAVTPFGAIDSPTQGGTASGSGFVNWGWVLTPKPNHIPTDGSTIEVYVDGVKLGNPNYNIYREDIAAAFPGYENTNGATGYYFLDTTAYEDGLHSIYWFAADSSNNREGIGSRTFIVDNAGAEKTVHRTSANTENVHHGNVTPKTRKYKHLRLLNADISDFPTGSQKYIRVKKGFEEDKEPQPISADQLGDLKLDLKQLERLEIHLQDPAGKPDEITSTRYYGYLVINSRLRPLPAGSFMDVEKGIFYWLPGPGFFGDYRFVFIRQDAPGVLTRKDVYLTIQPKY